MIAEDTGSYFLFFPVWFSLRRESAVLDTADYSPDLGRVVSDLCIPLWSLPIPSWLLPPHLADPQTLECLGALLFFFKSTFARWSHLVSWLSISSIHMLITSTLISPVWIFALSYILYIQPHSWDTSLIGCAFYWISNRHHHPTTLRLNCFITSFLATWTYSSHSLPHSSKWQFYLRDVQVENLEVIDFSLFLIPHIQSAIKSCGFYLRESLYFLTHLPLPS